MSNTKTNKVVILVRVSTADQKVNRQISELTEFATANNFEIVEIVTETISVATKHSHREGIQRLLKLAKTKQINKVLIHEVTRLGRDTAQVLATLEALHALKVSVVVKNYNLETLNPNGTVNLMAQFLFTLLKDIGRMERLTLIQGVKSGMEQARKAGKHLGRPEGTTKDILGNYPKVVKYLKAGNSVRESASQRGLPVLASAPFKG